MRYIKSQQSHTELGPPLVVGDSKVKPINTQVQISLKMVVFSDFPSDLGTVIKLVHTIYRHLARSANNLLSITGHF